MRQTLDLLRLSSPWRRRASIAVSGFRWTWCGRFALQAGFALLEGLRGDARIMGCPLAYETSMSAPPLDVSMPPLGFTAPASYEHFVGYPAVAFTFEPNAVI